MALDSVAKASSYRQSYRQNGLELAPPAVVLANFIGDGIARAEGAAQSMTSDSGWCGRVQMGAQPADGPPAGRFRVYRFSIVVLVFTRREFAQRTLASIPSPFKPYFQLLAT